MFNMYNKYKWLRLCTGIALLILGILAIVISFTNPGTISTIISIAAAIIFFIGAGILITATLIEDKRSVITPSLGVSAALIALGVVLCVKTELLSDIMVYFVATYAIGFGAIFLIRGIQLAKYKMAWYVYVTCFVLAAIGITLGILALCFESKVKVYIYVLLGCLLVANGIGEIVQGIKFLKN